VGNGVAQARPAALSAGHPCCHGKAGQPAPRHAAVHGQVAVPASGPAPRGNCCDPSSGCPCTCPGTSQALAVLGGPPARPAPRLLIARPGSPAAGSTSLLPLTIDHIPLPA